MLSADQSQVILGTLFGNSVLEESENGVCLIMKSRDKKWLDLKADCLFEFESSRWQSNGNYYWKSEPNDIFSKFFTLIYNHGNKSARMDCLDSFRDIGIMVWYGDTGCLVGRDKKNACVRTQAFGDTNEIIKQFFNEVNAPCNINQVRNKPVIVFTRDGTRMLTRIIGHLLPINRLHLLPPVF